MAGLIRDMDWSATPLGPMDEWPQSLKTTVDIMLANVFPMCIAYGPEHIAIYNDGYMRLFGDRHPSVLGRRTSEIFPEIWHHIVAIYERIYAGENRIDQDHSFSTTEMHLDNRPIYTTTLSPLRDETGAVCGVHAVTVETIEWVRISHIKQRADSIVREKEARFGAVTELVPSLMWSSDPDGRVNWFNQRYLTYTSQSLEDALERGWMWPVHPDDKEDSTGEYRKAFETGQVFNVEERLRKGSDGSYRWFLCRTEPLRDDEGRIVQWFGSATDIHDLRQAQEHERLLAAELQHRVRNTLAVTRSIAKRTAERSRTIEDFTRHFDGRLNAFARTQAVVTRDPTSGVDLEYIVSDELRAHGGRRGGNVRIEGPKLRLRSKPAETFGLAIHELATNAVKYGALSSPDGEIDIRWRLRNQEGVSYLRFGWIESGLRLDPSRPVQRGFGLDMLERSLAYEFQAVTILSLERTGLHYHVDLPLTDQVVGADV
ncbi:sensor histidine kinase [Microvirga pudoricolor]|uniref:sensor histidine kinase n=1 Tax=Microvirga pudoricolor TaxID=2778729 RepID=UPI0019508478|nr:HWE histidine kinase domain-containing protein [Microvirga pudoricolor]MBM6595588.1 PAS domain-containing protein [Microvirga pudoricolor]